MATSGSAAPLRRHSKQTAAYVLLDAVFGTSSVREACAGRHKTSTQAQKMQMVNSVYLLRKNIVRYGER